MTANYTIHAGAYYRLPASAQCASGPVVKCRGIRGGIVEVIDVMTGRYESVLLQEFRSATPVWEHGGRFFSANEAIRAGIMRPGPTDNGNPFNFGG